MSNTPQNDFKNVKPTLPPRSARDEMVDTLEHAYGPVALSLFFALFLALADPAHEVMLVFASEILDFGHNLAQGWLVLVIPLVVVALLFALSQFDRMPANEFLFVAGFLTAAMMLFLSILGTDFTTILDLNEEVYTDDAALLIPDFIAKYGLLEAGGVTRVVLGLVIFFYVPVALHEATRLGIWAQYHAASLPGQTLRTYVPHRADHLFLVWVGRLPLVGAAIGFATIIAGTEATGSEKIVVAAMLVICILVAALRFLTQLWREGDTEWNDWLVGLSRRSLAVGFGAVVAIVLMSGWFSASAEMAGPIPIVSSFVMLVGYGLAALTMISSRLPFGQFPLILVLVGVAAAVSGATSAFTICAFLALLTIGSLYFDQRGFEINSLTVFAFILAVGAGALGVLQYNAKECPSLAGCNLVQGVEPGDGWQDQGLADLGSAYEKWLEADARESIDEVVLIAAQGGGLFAGYHAAYDLASRQDATRGQDVLFSDSVFAISGVSGGSVGAAVFWAILQSGMCEAPAGAENPRCYRDAVRDVLGRDYLSAALSQLLFKDNLESLIPFSAWTVEPTDRGHTLFERLNAAVNRTLLTHGMLRDDTRDLMKRGLRNSWMADGAAPLLFLNTTDIQTGARVIQSPVSCFLAGCDLASHKVSLRLPSARVTLAGADNEPRDLTVGEAAVLSARFPIVTPPGRYLECVGPAASCEKTEQKQIADGGYFDNTGLETVADILSGLRSKTDKPIRVYSYSILEQPGPRTIKGTIGAPLSGLVAATTARRSLTVDRFCNRWVPKWNTEASPGGLKVSADGALLDLRSDATHNFTLSWLISPSSLNSIEARVDQNRDTPDPALCD